jgi:hypothetical protein
MEQIQPFRNRQPVLVAKVVERNALDQFHDEERAAAFRRAGVEQLGDVRMIHQRDRLPLRLEAGQDRLRLPTFGANELHCHFAFDRLDLVGQPDSAHAPFADLLPQLVASGDDAPLGFLGSRGGPVRAGGVGILKGAGSVGRGVQRPLWSRVGGQQRFDTGA